MLSSQAKSGHLVVIGTSAGGISALQSVVSGLPADLPAPVCVTIHISASYKESKLPEVIGRGINLKTKYAENGEPMLQSVIYIAPPDRHMLIYDGKLILNRGPKENLHRPAIDPLFRSAAENFDGATIGVILSGSLDDGSQGLAEIKRAGGMAIVQDPEEASFDGMPSSAIRRSKVDFILPAVEIGDRIANLCKQTAERNIFTPLVQDNESEAQTCPECGGPLSESSRERLGSYRCIVGHTMTEDSLWEAQSQRIDRLLWSAVRALQERANLSERIARRLLEGRTSYMAEKYMVKAEKSRAEAKEIEDLIRHHEDCL